MMEISKEESNRISAEYQATLKRRSIPVEVTHSSKQKIPTIVRGREMPSQSKYENRKVGRNHLSALMRFILLNADGGIQRGEITERFYGLDRRYSGYYTDPCLRVKQKSRYENRYRRAQPSISKALRRLEKRGLVRLIRRNKYVKSVHLTKKGRAMSNTLDNSDRSIRR